MKKLLSICSIFLTSGVISIPHAAASSLPTISVAVSPNPVVIGAQVTYTATVKGNGAVKPTGAVTIYLAGQDAAFCTLNATGVCSGTQFMRLFPASAQVIAQYAGDANYSFAVSAPVNLTVVAAPNLPATTTSLVSSANPSKAGESITLTAKVAPAGATGKVSFYFPGSNLPFVVPLSSNGTATTTTFFASAGKQAIAANYSGDTGHQGSATAITQVVSAPIVSSAMSFVPITPCRVVDTRNTAGPLGGPSLAAVTARSFPLSQGACGIPATAAAYSINVTSVPHGPLGYLTVWPTGQPQPLVSLLNSLDGRVKANAAIVSAGTSGAISVYSAGPAPSDVLIDISGYFVAAPATGLAFYPLTPCRAVDTRNAAGPLAGPYLTGGQPRAFPIRTSPCKIPAAAKAYSLNITAIPAGPLGYLTTWPTGQPQPTVSTLNALTGTVTANAAVVPAGTSGSISVFVTQSADVLVDVNGYFAPSGAGGLSLYAVAPCRVLDTRTSGGEPDFSDVLNVKVHDGPCAPPQAASAYLLNATVVPPGPLGFLTLGPAGVEPTVSTLNASDGAITSNMAIVPTTNGAIDAYAPSPTVLLLDLSGYFAQ